MPTEPLTSQPRPPLTTQPRPPTGPGTTPRPPKPTPETPEQPPTSTPPGGPPYGEELEEEDFCCGKKGMLITYPVTTDPLQPPPQYEAPRDPAVGAVQVFLHNGAFFTNQIDLDVPALAFDIVWTRHFRGDVEYTDGGLMGHGWDFVYNKRLVPIAARKLANGLFAEQARVEKPALWYYNGQGRAERYVEGDTDQSDDRDVFNFDTRFRAYVTRYQSPNGQFHEFERYILHKKEPHPFGEHPNVEKTERIFYVLREKNGTRYVFNCRGQVIYILSRNDSKARPVRVTLYYGGPINPLTQSRMLQLIEDATGRKYVVHTVPINQGSYATNYDCKPANGTAPIHRVERIVGGGLVVQYHYRSQSDPTLVAVTITPARGDARRWEYAYNAERQLTEYRDPNNCARGSKGDPALHNTYAGRRVTAQRMGGLTTTVDGTNVGLPGGDKLVYALGSAGGFPVIDSSTVVPKESGHGGPWRTAFVHNDDTQVVELRDPGGGGVRFRYAPANAPVTLGPIRDGPGVTYENNLARGNLLTVELFAREGSETLASHQTYEPLYNQLASSVDAAGNATRYEYGDYFTPSHRGNPTAIQDPPVMQPDGSVRNRPPNRFEYNDAGQRDVSNTGHGRTRYTYDADGQVIAIRYPGGGFERFERSGAGHVVSHVTHAGTTDYERDGFGMVTRRSVDPGGLAVRTDYRYDANGQEVEAATVVRDHLDGAPDLPGFTATTAYTRKIVRTLDDLGRVTREVIEGNGQNQTTDFIYGANGRLEEIVAPSLSGSAPHRSRLKHDARGLLVEFVAAAQTKDAHTTRRKYDDDARLIEVRAGYANAMSDATLRYDGLGRLRSWTDALGATTRLRHDALGNVTRVEVFSGTSAARRTDYRFDAYRNVIERTVDVLNGQKETSRWFYSEHLLLERIESPNGGETGFQYDSGNRVTQITDPLGHVTVNEYDFGGRLTSVTQRAPERRADGAAAGFAETPGQRVTTMRYDVLGRTIRVESPAGVEYTVYDSLNRVRATKSATGHVAAVSYDGLGRRQRVTGPLLEQEYVHTPGGLVSEVRGTGGHFRFSFDSNGRLRQHEDRRTGAVTKVEYQGFTTIAVDPNGTTITTKSNAIGLPLTIVAKPATRTVPGHPGFAVVGGSRSHTYEYDPLGRLVRAITDRDSEVVYEYDGLDRVVREHQKYAGQRHAVEHAFADDFSWSETTYPALADATRVRHVADRIGRIERVEADGRIVATYTYSGLDRLAARRAGNLVQTRYQYDDRERLTLVQVARRDSAAGPLGRVVWAQRSAYGSRGPEELVDTRFGDGAGPDTVMRTAFTRDTYGRATLTTTSLSAVVGPGGATADEISATAMRYDGARLVESLSFDGIADGRARSLRTDSFEYDDKADRVRRTRTEGGFDAKVATPTASAMPAAMAAADVTASGEQSFTYDANGNLVADGRYLYAYDFRNRLVLVEDTREPWGYRESVRFDYDALDRRIAIHRLRNVEPKQQLVAYAPPWIGGMTWLLYDGDRVIVEAFRNHPKAGPLPRFIARYVHGGRPGELLCFDRRPEADPNEDTRRFYVHEDVNGTIREVSDPDGRLHPVRQGDPLAVPGRPLGDRSPGEAVMVGRTGVRLPYIGGSTRVDSFAALVYRDDSARFSHDYRRAPNFHRAADRGLFAESITSAQTTGLIALGAITAAAFSPAIVGTVAPYLGTIGSLGARHGALGYGVSALSGGSVSFGFYGGVALYTGAPFSANEAAAAFATGALFGMAGGFVNGLGLGLVKSLAADVAVSFAVGTTLSLATGDSLATAANEGGTGALMDGVIGFAAGTYGAAARSVTSRMARQGARMAPQAPTHTATPGRRASPHGADDPALAQTQTGTLPVLEPTPPGFKLGRGVQWSAELRMLAQDMMFDLDIGSKVSAELARRIRHGELTVRIYSGKVDVKYARAAGYWRGGPEQNIVNINIDNVRRAPSGGPFRSESAASTIVHEGIHAMGGGEVSAHVGQAIFLYRTFKREILSVPRGIDLTKGDLPRVTTHHINLLNVVRNENMHRVVNHILSFTEAYSLRNLRLMARPVDPWIAAQGGWGRALNISDPIYDSMERNWRDWLPWANEAERAHGYRMGMF